MNTLHVETRYEATARLASTATRKLETDQQVKLAQSLAADAILGRNTVEHVTLWTESNGRAKHSSRVEVVS